MLLLRLTVQKCVIMHYAVVTGLYIMILPLKSTKSSLLYKTFCNAQLLQVLVLSLTYHAIWKKQVAALHSVKYWYSIFFIHSKKFKMREEVDSFLSEEGSNFLLTWKVNSIHSLRELRNCHIFRLGYRFWKLERGLLLW